MQLGRAVEILERLRDGEDPRTGKALASGDPAQAPDVVRALYTVLARLADGCGEDDSGDPAAAPKPDKPRPTRAGSPWTDDEDARLAAAFDGGETVAKLGKAFERSASAIRLRLVKLGRLSAEDAMTGRRRREPAAASSA